MKPVIGFLILNAFILSGNFAQTDKDSTCSHFLPATGSISAAYAGSIVGLYFLWYEDYSGCKFHFFNDNNEWRGMDKLGHSTSAFSLAQANTELYKLSGLNDKQALAWGSFSPFIYMLSIEMMDGFSRGWGFSWGDLGSNTAGILLYSSQKYFGHEPFFRLKYSFKQSRYADINPDLLGNNLIQQSLKDYNGQTYWLSCNLKNLVFQNQAFPSWLNLAVGYGSEGMVRAEASDQNLHFPDIKRYSQWYISPDIDFSAIRTNHKWIRFFLKSLNFIKIPAPGVQFDHHNGIKLKWIAI